nr:uncharacterized protein BOVATA_023730 [Ipomoea trifida]
MFPLYDLRLKQNKKNPKQLYNRQSTLHCQRLQMLYEYLQANIICEYNIFAICMCRIMSYRWVQFREEKPCLTTVLIAFDEPRNRKALGHQLLSVDFWSFQQFPEAFMARVFVIPEFSPLCDLRAIMYDDVEVGVEEKNDVWGDGAHVE